MRWFFSLSIGLVLFVVAAECNAQTLLDQLESRLQPGGTPAAGGAAAATPAPNGPGTGYLGAVLNESAEPGRGVKVDSVRPGGPAEKSGLKADDVITAVGSTTIKSL